MIYPYTNFLLGTVVALTASACFTAAFAWIKTLWLLLLFFALNGACLGYFESGSNVYIIYLWGKETPPFMQSLQFMFGVGALLVPMIIKPFLIVRDESEEDELKINEYHPEDVQLWIPFTIIAAFLLFNAISVLIVWIKWPITDEHPSRIAQSTARTHPIISSRVNDKPYQYWKITVIILCAMFMHIYLGLEISFGQFLMTFAHHSDLHLSKSIGAYMTTLFWATYTFTRIGTIMFIDKLGNARIIQISALVTLAANVPLVWFGNSSEPCLWAGVAMIGIGMSAVWACMFGFLEEFFPITSIIGSTLVVSAVLGEFVFPVIISSFVKDYPQVLLWVVLVCSILFPILFILIKFICDHKLTKLPLADRKFSRGISFTPSVH